MGLVHSSEKKIEDIFFNHPFSCHAASAIRKYIYVLKTFILFYLLKKALCSLPSLCVNVTLMLICGHLRLRDKCRLNELFFLLKFSGCG